MALHPAQKLLDAARKKGLRLATAESCTGGMIAAALTDIAGASEVFDCGFVAYANDAKTGLLDVAPAILAAHGAVSAETAAAMAEGALRRSRADMSVAVTGIAGPGGGTAEKPVGLVYIAVAARNGATQVAAHRFDGDRAAIRRQTVASALDMLAGAVAAFQP